MKMSSKKDFSIRHEVEVIAKETLGLELTTEQVDDVVNEIEDYDTFLSIVSLFVTKGIMDMAKKENIKLDQEEMDYQLGACRQGINFNDL
jgi:hypothetical protein